MAKVEVIDWNKKKVGQVELSADVFEQPIRKDILHTVVRWQLASRRRGTHKAKTRAQVSGTGKKPYKQKGTGNARRGSERSPILVGGGVTFGPKPRDYSYNLPRKVKQAAFKSALSHLQKEGKLWVIDSLSSADGKTKELSQNLKKLGLAKAVLIDNEPNDMMKRASRNMQNVRYYSAEGMNVYDLLKMDAAIITKDSVEKITQRCGVNA